MYEVYFDKEKVGIALNEIDNGKDTVFLRGHSNRDELGRQVDHTINIQDIMRPVLLRDQRGIRFIVQNNHLYVEYYWREESVYCYSRIKEGLLNSHIREIHKLKELISE